MIIIGISVCSVWSTMRYWESQVLLAVVIDRTFTLGGGGGGGGLAHAYSHVKAVGLDGEIILTVKFSRSTVFIISLYVNSGHDVRFDMLSLLYLLVLLSQDGG